MRLFALGFADMATSTGAAAMLLVACGAAALIDPEPQTGPYIQENFGDCMAPVT
jgi:hypothetical protein